MSSATPSPQPDPAGAAPELVVADSAQPVAYAGAAPIIHVHGLSKIYKSYDRREGVAGALHDLFQRRYKEVRAVDGIDFDIRRGEIVGYIGSNGAGKSTTIKMLTGILAPTSGTIEVNGLVPSRERYAHAHQIGVVFGQRTQLWWDLAVIEAFNLLQKIYQIPPADYRRRLDRFIEVLEIQEQLHTPVRKLSLGQRMKCDLAASLLHGPPILFLDEPTIGLDVAVKERVRRFIRQINAEEQVTIILTTHDLTDIEELCERIIIIDGGKILYDGSREDLLDRFGRRRRIIIELKKDYVPDYAARTLSGDDSLLAFSAETLDEPGARQLMQELLAVALGSSSGAGGAALSTRDGSPPLRIRRLAPRHFQIGFDRTLFSASELIDRLLERYEIEDMSLREPELSDIVRAIYEGRNVL